jgi:hypothetical protein
VLRHFAGVGPEHVAGIQDADPVEPDLGKCGETFEPEKVADA